MDFDELIIKLENEKKFARDNYVPIIREKSAKFLYDFVKKNEIKNILEIGTAIGFSGSIMLTAGANTLTTIDINQDYINVAKETFKKLNLLNCVEIYNDDAWIVINQLKSQNRKFDMIFLDGAKGQYIKYLSVLKDLLSDNGCIFADNVLLQGMVESDQPIPHKKRTMVVNLRKYLDAVAQNPFETELVRIEDGIAITKIKGEK